MNTKAVIDAIDRALEETINYTTWDQKIAYLNGLAAICVHIRTNTVLLPLTEVYKRIVNCRTVFEQAKLKDAKDREAEHEQLLIIPEGTYDEEEVFDAVPEEATVVENHVNTILNMAQAVIAPETIDHAQREQVEPVVYESTAEALEQIIQQNRDAFVIHTNSSPHEAVGEAIFAGLDVQKDGCHLSKEIDDAHDSAGF